MFKLQTGGWDKDTIHHFQKCQSGHPGIGQLLNCANAAENVEAKDSKNGTLSVRKINDNTWSIAGIKNKKFNLSYEVKAEKQFVAQSYLDTARASYYSSQCLHVPRWIFKQAGNDKDRVG